MNNLVLLVVALMAAASNAQTCFNPIALYKPTSDVTSTLQIDLDIDQVDDATNVPDFPAAATAYNSKLKAFSTGAQAFMGGQTYFDMYKTYWGSATYGDDNVQAALTPSAPYSLVAAPNQDVVRRETMLKTIQYQIVWMQVVGKMENAVNLCKQTTPNIPGALVSWDEAVALYTGSTDAADGGSGFSLYAGAHKRCNQFGTCVGNPRKALANRVALSHFAEGQVLLAGSACTAAAAVIPKIVAQMTIPLIQGALRYAVRGVDDATVWEPGSTTGSNKERAEGYAFVAGVLPQIAKCNADAAALIKANMAFGTSPYMKDGKNAVLAAFQSTYKCMNIKCAEVGAMTETVNSVTSVLFPTCTDVAEDVETEATVAPRPGSANTVSAAGSVAFVVMMSWYIAA